MNKIKLILLVVAVASLCAFMVPSAQAASLTPQEEQYLASLSSILREFARLLDAWQKTLIAPAYASGNPPPAPGWPSGISSVRTNSTYSYLSRLAPDPDGDQLKIIFDWGDGTTFESPFYTVTGGEPWGKDVVASHAWTLAGNYTFRTKARDTTGLESGWSTYVYMTVGDTTNNPPPSIADAPTGPTSVTTQVSYQYSAGLYPDMDGDQVQAVFDWGDGSATTLSSFLPTPQANGTTSVSVSHTWTAAGTYYVKVSERDDHGGNSSYYSNVLGVYVTVSGSCAATTINNVSLLSADNGAFVMATTSSSSVLNGTRYVYATFTCTNGSFVAGPDAADIKCNSGYTSLGTECVDITLPSTPIGLSATVVSSSQINLSWLASTDAVGVTGYKVYRNGTYLTSVTTVSYSDTGLTAGIAYSYTVAAVDGAGNVSAQSSSVSVITQSSTVALVHPWPMLGGNAQRAGRSVSAGPSSPSTSWSSAIAFTYSSPVVASDGTVYIATGNGLVAYRSNGTAAWTGAIGSHGHAVPAIGPDGSVYMGSSQGLHAFSSTGAVKWTYGGIDFRYASPIVGSDGTIYAGSYAFNPDGTAKWTPAVSLTYASALGPDGTLYAGSYAFNPNGTKKWGPLSFGEIVSYVSPVIGSDGTIYIGTTQGKFYAINPNGTTKWMTQLGGQILATAAIDGNGIIYVTTGYGLAGSSNEYSGDNKLYALNADGSIRWTYQAGNWIWSTPALDGNGAIYFTARNGFLYSVSSAGQLKWTVSVGGGEGSPAIADGKIFASSFTSLIVVGGGSDAQAPSMPTGLTASVVSSSQINLSWNASTDAVGVTGYKVYRNGTYLTSVTTPSYSDSGLTAGTSYSYTVAAYDAAGNVSSQSSAVSAATQGSSNVPSVDIKVDGVDGTVTRAAPANYTLAWTATNNPTNCSPGGTWSTSGSKSVPSGSWNFLGVTVLGLKTYTLTCSNSYGSGSDTVYVEMVASSTVTSDTQAPSVPASISASVVSSSQINLSWPASTDNVGVAGYKIYRNSTYLASVTATSYSDTGLTVATSYSYTVAAYDAVGNVSPQSASVSATTASAASTTAATTTTVTTTTTTAVTPIYQTPTTTGETFITATTTLVSAPIVPFAVDIGKTFPQPGSVTVDSTARISIKFTKDIDSASLTANFFTLASAAAPSAPLSGSFATANDGFVFTPSAGLQPNATYIYTVLPTVKDKSGTFLSSAFSATFTTGSAAASLVKTGEVIGKVTDGAGIPLVGATVYFSPQDPSLSRNIATDATGAYSVFLPEGVYRVELFSPSGRTDLIRPAPSSLAVVGGQKQTLHLQFPAGTKVITGLILFSNTQVVSDVEVGAYSSDSGQEARGTVDAKGRYTLRVGGGKWQVGIRPKDSANAKWSYSGPFPVAYFSRDAVAETQIADFLVPVFDATIRVRAVDESGNAIAGAGIALDTVSSAAAVVQETRTPPQFLKSDSAGIASFTVRGGIYYIRGTAAAELGLINPDEQAVTIYTGEVKDIRLIFRKSSSVVLLTLSGITKLEDGAPTNAFVWAWSERGGFARTRADAAGIFTLPLAPDDRWHLGAGKEADGIAYKASDVVLAVGSSPLSIEIILGRAKEIILQPVSASKSATETIVVQAPDGAKMTLPSSAVAGSGTVSVEVKPTVEAPSQAAAHIVSTVYDVTVRDTAGTTVTKLNDIAEIVLPYREEDLKAQGVSEDVIVPSSFDETFGVWVKIDNYTVDKDKNIVVARVKHLTRFAIVAAADITPPLAPTAVSASALGGGKIQIAWTNPSRDFSHAKVYKSERAGALGEILAAEVSGIQTTDAAVRNGITYYYTVRAVDPAGNESGNTNQAAIRAIGTSPALVAPFAGTLPSGQAAVLPSGALSRNLGRGSSGEDVKILQSLLLKEEVYPEGLITGYFGNLTRQAVIRFQEKYHDEILAPLGFTNGTGFVGKATRVKLQQRMGG